MEAQLLQQLAEVQWLRAEKERRERDEEFALGIDPKSLHATVLMQMVYNAVIWHSGGFLKHVAISVTEKGRITVAA